jgi:hypothetical protein
MYNLLPLRSYDKENSKQALAEMLSMGSLALVMGAGASKGLGLPLWFELVNRCLKYANLEDKGLVDSKSDPNTLLKKIEIVERATGQHYREIVQKSLYDDRKIKFTRDVIKQELLISFGALLMGSKRGNINEVINFNFDNVLEWYLDLHGHKSQKVKKLPFLYKDSDVTIYHPHGYLPHPDLDDTMSDFLIFSKRSYDERLGNFNIDPWITEGLIGVLKKKIAIFVGLSGNDPIFGPMLNILGKALKEKRLTGFWLFPNKLSEDELEDLYVRNIAPICFNNYQEIPYFLLGVCQDAAKLEK